MYLKSPTVNYMFNIEHDAEQFTKEHHQMSLLDYSISSLDLVENFIDDNLIKLSEDIQLKGKLSSYILKTLANNYSSGKIEIEKNNKAVFIFDSYQDEKLDVENYIDSRLVSKQGNNFGYSL